MSYIPSGVPNMYGTKAMHIARLLMIETGVYDQQWRRSYQTYLDGELKNQILTSLDSAKNITAPHLARAASNFFTLSQAPEAEVAIPNGWGMRRFRFVLEVVSQDRTGMQTRRQFITGYTDHSDVGFAGAYDPRMVFYIDKVNTMQENNYNTPMGMQQQLKLIDASQVLSNDQYNPQPAGPSGMFMMRPEDIFAEIDSLELKEATSSGFVSDGRSILLHGNANKSHHMNTIAPVAAAQVLNSYLQNGRANDYSSAAEINDAAIATVQSQFMSDDPFISFLRSRNAMTGGKTFTLADLSDLDPMIASKIERPAITAQMASSLPTQGEGQRWEVSDYITYATAALAQAVPGYMSTLGISAMHLKSTNRTIGGVPDTRLYDIRSLTLKPNMGQEGEVLKFRLENEILPSLTYGMTMDYELQMVIDSFGDTFIELSLNGSPMVPYIAPTFCSALWSPVVTQNHQTLQNAAGDFSSLMSEICEMDRMRGQSTGMQTGLL